MSQHLISPGLKVGTIGGTLFSMVMTVPQEDMIKAAILAAIGNFVSFTVSVTCKYMWQVIKKKIKV
jgi:hypothetical protein